MTDDVIATGSEDGMIRVMQILPNKFRELVEPFGRARLMYSGSHCNSRRIPNRTNEVGSTRKMARKCQS